MLTSLANRTSPVLRGKWVMEVLMGTPPPPPPPDTPVLEDIAEVADGRRLTTRERMEMHAAKPRAATPADRFIDPIGLSLDNFDVTGKWRIRENGGPLDTRGDFYDGTPVSSPAQLVDALLVRPIPLARTFTENLLAFAIGRPMQPFDGPTVRNIARAAEANDHRMASFIMGVVSSDAFQRKRGRRFVPRRDDSITRRISRRRPRCRSSPENTSPAGPSCVEWAPLSRSLISMRCSPPASVAAAGPRRQRRM